MDECRPNYVDNSVLRQVDGKRNNIKQMSDWSLNSTDIQIIITRRNKVLPETSVSRVFASQPLWTQSEQYHSKYIFQSV